MELKATQPLTEAHIRAWTLLLLHAATRAGLTPVSPQLFHRLMFLSSALGGLYSMASPIEFVLKRSRGPFYPQTQFVLETLVVHGLAHLHNLQWVRNNSEIQMLGVFSLTDSGRSQISLWRAESTWARRLTDYLMDICSGVAALEDGREIPAADRDLTYDQRWAKAGAVIAFRHPGARLSELAATGIAELIPNELRPSSQGQLRLYLRYLERLAA